MVSRLTFLALTGVLALACKSPESGDTDAASSSTGMSTVSPTDPTTTTLSTLSTVSTVSTDPATTGTSGEPVTSTLGTGSMGTSEGTATSENTTGPVGPCVPLACDGKVWACGDCMDNDGDGKTDLNDPECISPCDDKEDSFATGLPGDNMDPCKQDCFFDGNSGNDACDWNLACDPANPGGEECPYDPDKVCEVMQPEECASTCGVPNGCDCFGCCTVVVDGVTHDIFIGDDTCTVAEIESCQVCTKNDDCDDECVPEDCEICFGGELPPGCEDPTCNGGEGIPCMLNNEGQSDCAEGTYCQTGCCVPIVPG